MSVSQIELTHVGGEKRLVEITGYGPTTISFRWPMAGVYDIRVKSNVIVGLKMWCASDHDELKRISRFFLWEQENRAKERRYAP